LRGIAKNIIFNLSEKDKKQVSGKQKGRPANTTFAALNGKTIIFQKESNFEFY